MHEGEVRAGALESAGRSSIAMVGTLGEDGDPRIKAMTKGEHEGLKTIWSIMNTSGSIGNQVSRTFIPVYQRWTRARGTMDQHA